MSRVTKFTKSIGAMSLTPFTAFTGEQPFDWTNQMMDNMWPGTGRNSMMTQFQPGAPQWQNSMWDAVQSVGHTDIVEHEKEYRIHLDLPGVNKKDLQLNLLNDNGILAFFPNVSLQKFTCAPLTNRDS